MAKSFFCRNSLSYQCGSFAIERSDKPIKNSVCSDNPCALLMLKFSGNRKPDQKMMNRTLIICTIRFVRLFSLFHTAIEKTIFNLTRLPIALVIVVDQIDSVLLGKSLIQELELDFSRDIFQKDET